MALHVEATGNKPNADATQAAAEVEEEFAAMLDRLRARGHVLSAPALPTGASFGVLNYRLSMDA